MGIVNGISPHQMKCLLWLADNPGASPREYAEWLSPQSRSRMETQMSAMFSRMIDRGFIEESHELSEQGKSVTASYSLRKSHHVPVPMFDGYFATRSGEVWGSRLSRSRVRQFLLKLQGSPLGPYLEIQLYTGNGIAYTTIHSVVIRTFKGEPPEGLECRHLDGNPSNNHIDNLEWGTAKQNAEDRELHGRTPRGESHFATTVTNDDVKLIRNLAREGMTYAAIGSRLNLKSSTVGAINRGQNWSHV